MNAIDLSGIKRALYIKLGIKGCWEQLCFADGTLRLGYYRVPEQFDPATDRKKIFDLYRATVANNQTASNHVRQVADFYNAGPETLWITFADGRLWWAQSHKAVEFFGQDRSLSPDGSRLKRTMFGWRNNSLGGNPLKMNELSGKLTRSAAYRQTICDIRGEAFDYLLHKLKDEDVAAVSDAKKAKAALLASVENLIRLLTWQDFELFVELLFSSSGWRRVSLLGGTQKTADIELVSPLTDERAFVQVKSQTSQQELNHYIEEFNTMTAERFFFAYHSAKVPLESYGETVILLGPEKLAEAAVRSGLADWLIKKIG